MICSVEHMLDTLTNGRFDKVLTQLYGAEAIQRERLRFQRLLEKQVQQDRDTMGMIVSAPGRTELGGNHTDHNHGNVLAAAVDLDCVAVVSPQRSDQPQQIVLVSEDYPDPIRIELDDLEPSAEEVGSAEALVRGMAALFYRETGLKQGFWGYLSATCKPGTGLSSSAAFSVLIGGTLNFLFNSGRLSAERLAHMAKEAENLYFGKPCGLMDQMSSSVGGTLAIDFKQPESPVIRRVAVPASASGYSLMIVDTGGSHVELTAEYAAIPDEMCAAAAVLGAPVARGLSLEQFMDGLPEIRAKAGDRAALRLMHFIGENDRAIALAEALRIGDFGRYLELVRLSGESSAMLLQNCASSSSITEQGILLALALTRSFCPDAVARVHGGGFAGTVQVYVPEREVDSYTRNMEKVFGQGSVIPLQIGRPGIIGISTSGLVLTPCECGD